MSRTDRYIGIFFMVLSVVVYALTYQFPSTQIAAFSAKIFPRAIAVCLFLLSANLLLQKNVQKSNGLTVKQRLGEKSALYIRLALIIVWAYGYVRILPLAGYIGATPLFMAGTMRIFDEKRWSVIAATSIATSLLLYLVFRMVFKVPLPRFSL